MRLSLNLTELRQHLSSLFNNRFKPTDIREFIETTEGMDMRENNGELEFTDGDPTSQVELLVLGINFGKQKEREFWEAPESFQIHESYAKLLKEAINNYATKSFTMVHGIKIDEVQNDFQFVNVTFSPQQVIHLYGIFVELGRMIERKGE